MSRDEISRLVGDVMSDPALIQEAMTIQDQHGLEQYISDRGYDLTKNEIVEVWAMTAKVMAGHSMPMSETQARINAVKNGVQAPS